MPKTEPRQKPFPEAEEKSNGKQNGEYIRPVFVRCDLTADQKAEMAQWANARSSADLLDMVIESASAGYTLSLKTADTGFQAALTMPGPAKIGVKNAGKSLVVRATKPERALWSLYYKHTQILEGDWSTATSDAQLDW